MGCPECNCPVVKHYLKREINALSILLRGNEENLERDYSRDIRIEIKTFTTCCQTLQNLFTVNEQLSSATYIPM